jgi:1,4-alpha-glucan branching enzyme
MEEDWLFEAITETYVPLLWSFERLAAEGVDFRITMSMTPPLVSMLMDRLLQERYVRHMRKLIDLSRKEVIRTKFLGAINKSARRYLQLFQDILDYFLNHNCDLVGIFSGFQNRGNLEIITCGATHGFLPFMQICPQAQKAQIQIAREHYQCCFGRPPRGIWLPECAYIRGVENILAENGISYFFTDAHGILYGEPRPKYGIYSPVLTPAGVAAFGRDLESSQQVWSSIVGYPGHSDYREFYRDIGYDLDFDYIRPYIHPDGIRVNTGIKYHRITGRVGLMEKEPYDWERAMEQAKIHARDFVNRRRDQALQMAAYMPWRPIVVSPYDAELFGHWWYEGPAFIEEILRLASSDESLVRTLTPSEYLTRTPRIQPVRPINSTWGAKGYNEVWLETSNDWIYRHLNEIAVRMADIARKYYNCTGIEERALNQLARELLLAQSSDWAFIMKTNTTVQYARKRTKIHVDRFLTLCDQLSGAAIDSDYLTAVEERDNIFPAIDFRVYARP